ncbi:MAG: DUF3095 family protein [Saprospiraceae bacterium]
MNNEHFYTDLPIHTQTVNNVLTQLDAFQQIPPNWSVIVTDIKGSTLAVKEGLSELVNQIATGSIIAALNIAAKSKLDIPFFFGGDGATLLVPPILLSEIMDALILHQKNVKKEINIDLRFGYLSISALSYAIVQTKIAKVSINKIYAIPIVLGDGLQYAEKIIKARTIDIQDLTADTSELNLEGMECRWNRISPPRNTDEVVCLLIFAKKESEQATIFKKVLDKADKIYGAHKKRNPISLAKLRMNIGLRKIRTELRLRKPSFRLTELIKNWIFMIGGKYWYLPSKGGQKYLQQLVQLADIFVLDGKINMVISGKGTQRKRLLQFLDKMEMDGEIIYGFHASKDSVISCYVRNRDEKHIHFIDGGDGGYTKAAVLLKEKLRKDALM